MSASLGECIGCDYDFPNMERRLYRIHTDDAVKVMLSDREIQFEPSMSKGCSLVRLTAETVEKLQSEGVKIELVA